MDQIRRSNAYEIVEIILFELCLILISFFSVLLESVFDRVKSITYNIFRVFLLSLLDIMVYSPF